jgi:hypothetical protein
MKLKSIISVVVFLGPQLGHVGNTPCQPPRSWDTRTERSPALVLRKHTLDARIPSIYIMDPSPLSQHNQQTHLGLQIEIKMLTRFYRSSHRIPGHRPPSAHRGKPSAQAVPNENLCTKHRGCKVSFLVLLDEAPKGQEGERRDR